MVECNFNHHLKFEKLCVNGKEQIPSDFALFLCGFVSGVDFGFYETIVMVIAKNTGH